MPFLDKARRASAPGRRSSGRGSAGRSGGGGGEGGSGLDARAVREWAQSNGVAVSPRGRISGEVLEKYRAANG